MTALEAVSTGLRRELEGFGVSVSLVQPAYVNTAIFDKVVESVEAVRRNGGGGLRCMCGLIIHTPARPTRSQPKTTPRCHHPSNRLITGGGDIRGDNGHLRAFLPPREAASGPPVRGPRQPADRDHQGHRPRADQPVPQDPVRPVGGGAVCARPAWIPPALITLVTSAYYLTFTQLQLRGGQRRRRAGVGARVAGAHPARPRGRLCHEAV